MNKLVFTSFFSLFALTTTSLAQGTKIITGLSVTGMSGSGCVSDFQPPRNPGYPNAIRCTLNLKSTVTYRGDVGADGNINGTSKISGPDILSFADYVGNSYSNLTSTYRANPCAGTSCYAEFRTDNAPRYFYHETVMPTERLRAVNGNPLVKSVFAYNLSADGMMISHEFEGARTYFDVNENEVKKYEIFIDDQNGRNSLSLKTDKSPYRIEWVQPNLARTPHKEIVSGVSFQSIFDNQVGHWRFFMVLDGTRFPQKGTYVVNYNVIEENPVKVEYLSSVEGLLTFNNRRVNQGFVTVGVGIQSCIQGALGFPDITPHYNEIMSFIKKVRSKTSSKAIAKLRGESLKRETRELGRAASSIGKMYKNLFAINGQLKQRNILTVETSSISSDTTTLDDTITRVIGTTKTFKKGFENVGRLSTVSRRLNKLDKKFVKAIKLFEANARSTGTVYLDTLRSAMQNRNALNASANQCELEQSSGQ